MTQLVLATGLLGASAWQAPAGAQETAARPPQQVPAQGEAIRTYDIPAGMLSTVLARYASESGALVAGAGEIARGVTSPGVRGAYTARAALTRLLAGTGLEAVQDAKGQYRLRPAPANSGGTSTLPAVSVTGSAIDTVASRVNPPTTIGSKIPLTQREIPQSVTVITQEQLQTQKIVTLDDAMRRTPGVFTEKNDGGRATYYSRGFPIDNIQVDGTPTYLSLLTNTSSLNEYESVEVLRGPAGLLNSIGGPGGAINLVRKKPTAESMLTAEASVGNYGDYRQSVDASSALNEAGTLRGRVSGSLLNQDTSRRGAHRNEGSLYGVLEYDLSPSTLLRAGMSYDRQKHRDQYDGYPAYPDGSLLGSAWRRYFGADWNKEIYTTTDYFAEVEQKLGGEWSGKMSFSHRRIDYNQKQSSASAAIDPATDTVLMRNLSSHGTDKQDSVDAYLAGPYWLLGRKHQLTVGASYLHDDMYQSNQYISADNLAGYQPISIHGMNIDEPSFEGPLFQRTTRTTIAGVFANTRISLADPLTMVLGGRMSWWRSRLRPDADANAFNLTPARDSISAHFTPYAGMIYDVDTHHSVYGSYTKIFSPQTQRDADGELLKPLTGDQYEVGVKGAYLDGRLNAGLALFQLTQENRAQLDRGDITGDTYVPQGKARARGVEATLQGEILPGWDMSAGYTYTATKYLDDSANTNSAFSAIAPKHMFKLWTNYRLPGEWNAWSVGGGTYVTSGFYNDGTDVRVSQGGYFTVDGRIAYRLTPRTQVSLNVFNIFDRRYYERLGDVTGGNWPGAPRTVMLTVRASY